MNRDGAAGPNSIRWTSKYGSLVAAGWDVGSADGMNEKGLVANMLYLVESEFAKPADNDKRKPLSISVWPQYVLDNLCHGRRGGGRLCVENRFMSFRS